MANSKNHCNHRRTLDRQVLSELGVLGRGQIPWRKREMHENFVRLSEVEYAYMLSRSDLYLFEDGVMKGKPDYGKIAQEVNAHYHQGKSVRDRYSVRSAVWKYGKKIDKNKVL